MGGNSRRYGLPSAPKDGLCGCMADGQAYYTSFRGYRPAGEATSSPNLRAGPPPGALRRWSAGAPAPAAHLPTGLWGMRKGKADGGWWPAWREPGGLPHPRGPQRPPTTVTLYLFCPSRGSWPSPRRTIVTWLILPVVICLSQRLSHACLSISNYTAKLRMAH